MAACFVAKLTNMTESKGGYANKREDGEKKEAVLKLMIKWEGHLIQFFSIDRVEPVEEYDAESPTGAKYGFLVRCMSYPNEIKFLYGSPELRDRKLNEFNIKMIACKAIII